MINININKNSNQSGRKERMECSADTKLFFDDVYKSGTQGKKQQVDVLQYGRSMIEMLGVLAIVGVLSVGGIAGYSKAMEKFKTNQILNDLSHLITNIQMISANRNYDKYSWINSSYGHLKDILGTYDAFDLNTGKHLFNGYGLYITTTYGVGDHKTFTISLENLPKQPCIEIATMDWGSSFSNFVGLTVGESQQVSSADHVAGTLVENCNIAKEENRRYFACAPKTPLPVSIAAEWCSQYANQDYGGINLVFN